MLDYHLFLGFLINPTLQSQLKEVPPNLHSLFIQNHPDYLQLVESDGANYLGKNLGNISEVIQLELVLANIKSLLLRLLPHYDLSSEDLVLLTLPAQDKSVN